MWPWKIKHEPTELDEQVTSDSDSEVTVDVKIENSYPVMATIGVLQPFNQT